ncbi:hypothetical protein [Cellulomonas hominis]|uniref:hypothetical protein n=1 Tax=Cellulomonas hominis TaxID=156981 RepID=UPI001B9C49CF|nr:hypothetical protein [Cellulomonas hominis]VTR76978.1 hypothetical protein CHMI_01746 [Cellulomonas hominis]
MAAPAPDRRTKALLLGVFPLVALLGLVLLLRDDDPPSAVVVCVVGLSAVSAWALTMQLTRWRRD